MFGPSGHSPLGGQFSTSTCWRKAGISSARSYRDRKNTPAHANTLTTKRNMNRFHSTVGRIRLVDSLSKLLILQLNTILATHRAMPSRICVVKEVMISTSQSATTSRYFTYTVLMLTDVAFFSPGIICAENGRSPGQRNPPGSPHPGSRRRRGPAGAPRR